MDMKKVGNEAGTGRIAASGNGGTAMLNKKSRLPISKVSHHVFCKKHIQ